MLSVTSDKIYESLRFWILEAITKCIVWYARVSLSVRWRHHHTYQFESDSIFFKSNAKGWKLPWNIFWGFMWHIWRKKCLVVYIIGHSMIFLTKAMKIVVRWASFSTTKSMNHTYSGYKIFWHWNWWNIIIWRTR